MSFSETALCCGGLVLQRIKDLITSSTFGPIFSVLVVLRIEAAVGFSATK